MRSGRALVWPLIPVIIVLGQVAFVQAQTAPSAALTGMAAAAACAPLEGPVPPASEGLRILGAQDTIARYLYGLDDLVVVNGGTQAGVQLNQEYFIRRGYAFGPPARSAEGLRTIHTAGSLRIVAVNDTTSIARIQSVCDGVMAGDYLEPFAPPALIADDEPGTAATLDFSSLGRVKFGDEERTLGAPGDFMLVDSGGAALAPGVRVAVYRDLRIAGLPLAAIGEGVIVSVENGTPLMRISSARDAIQSGDYVVRYK